jgi:hypothetical protein
MSDSERDRIEFEAEIEAEIAAEAEGFPEPEDTDDLAELLDLDDEPEPEEPAAPRQRRQSEGGDAGELQRLRNERQVAQFRVEAAQRAQFAQQEFEQFLQLSTEDQQRYWHQKAMLQASDQADSAAFDQLKRRDPDARRHAKQVEATLAQVRQQGVYPSREVVLNNILGQEMRARRARGLGRSTGQAAPRAAPPRMLTMNGSCAASRSGTLSTGDDAQSPRTTLHL